MSMDILTSAELGRLVEEHPGRCVSLYMPAMRAGRETRQNPIRFKNLLAKAEAELVGAGVGEVEAGELLAPARALLGERPFWQHQGDGLAAFLAPGLFRTFRLPRPLTELVVVGDRFHVKPLLPLVSEDGRYYVLALSQDRVRLFQGSRFSLCEVGLGEAPASLEEALRWDDPEEQLQFHTRTAGQGGKRPAMFHGQGVGTDGSRHKDDLVRFFRQVDRGVQAVLGGERVPLVLAGVDYLLPLYREASSHPRLVAGQIEGSPQQLDEDALRRRAWELVEPLFSADRRRAAEEYGRAVSSGQATGDLGEAVAAAWHGRVETLFVALGRQRWGQFDPQTGRVSLHEEAQADDQDLLDLAAVRTLLSGGRVYVVDPEEVPGGGPVAALLRY
ncbi:MAG: hypothetical protein ACP5G2_00605 [Candidatus Bipolaricaulaceae bacterium]